MATFAYRHVGAEDEKRVDQAFAVTAAVLIAMLAVLAVLEFSGGPRSAPAPAAEAEPAVERYDWQL
ncbi:hypothetical protein HSX11_10645 [Oxalobacteraceae bacterium]|nr:hypothetical protein [Oxalobacteraceae bacterium]